MLHYVPTEAEAWARSDTRAFPRVDDDAYILRGIIANMSREHLELMVARARSADTRAMAARRLATK